MNCQLMELNMSMKIVLKRYLILNAYKLETEINEKHHWY